MRDINSKKFKNFTFQPPHQRGSRPPAYRTVRYRYMRSSQSSSLRAHVTTQTLQVIFKTHTCKSSFHRNSHSNVLFRIWKIDIWSEFSGGKISKDLPIQELLNSYCNLSDRETAEHSENIAHTTAPMENS